MEKTGLKPIDQLLRMAQEGNGNAFTALWDNHIDQLRLYIHRTTKDLNDYDVDDVCSRSFEKAFRQIGTFDSSKGQFFTWLKTIARNTALDFIATEKRRHPKDQFIYLDDEQKHHNVQDKYPTSDKNAEETMIFEEEQETTLGYINKLPQLYKEVAQKRLIDGMKYKEIAEELGLELNTVKTRINRAKNMIENMKKMNDSEN